MRRILIFVMLLVSLGASAAEPSVDKVKVEKSTRKLYLLQAGKVVREFPVALGGNPTGHKQQEGDQRTPEGRYVLDFKKSDSGYYKAIHISYPDAADSEGARKPMQVHPSKSFREGGAAMQQCPGHHFVSRFWEFNVRLLFVPAAAIAAVALQGCSSQQLYATGQAWQQNECNKIVDMQERQRCMSKASSSYDTYQRQATEAKNPK
jgi:hypothetical protein